LTLGSKPAALALPVAAPVALAVSEASPSPWTALADSRAESVLAKAGRSSFMTSPPIDPKMPPLLALPSP
jgi:hypothetical protein